MSTQFRQKPSIQSSAGVENEIRAHMVTHSATGCSGCSGSRITNSCSTASVAEMKDSQTLFGHLFTSLRRPAERGPDGTWHGMWHPAADCVRRGASRTSEFRPPPFTRQFDGMGADRSGSIQEKILSCNGRKLWIAGMRL